MKLLVFLLFIVGTVLSTEKAGDVVNKRGKVKLYREGSLSGLLIREVPSELYVKDVLKTDFASIAFVKLLGVNKLVLMENSILYIEDIDRVNFEKGRAVFQIRKRGESRGLKVRVKSVIIGIKGTRFMISAEEERIGIFLKEGHLTVRKIVGEFIRYKKREKEEFEEFRQEAEKEMKKQMEEYERFKEETEKEFREFVKEFELKAGSGVIIVGSEVRDIPIPPDIEEEFRLLDTF